LNHVCSIHWMFLYGIHCWRIGHFGIVQNIYCKCVFHFIFVFFTWLHLASRNLAFCLMLMHIFASVVLLDPSLHGPRLNLSSHVFAVIYAHFSHSMWIAFFFCFIILYWFLYVCSSNLTILWPVYLANDKKKIKIFFTF